MSLSGVYVDPGLQTDALAATLPANTIDRYTASPKVIMFKKCGDGDTWLTLDETYPGQIRERFGLLQTYGDYVIDRENAPDVRAAEIELRDMVVDSLLTTYPEYFRRKGDMVVSPLTGLAVDIGPGGADPMVAVALLASEDMVMMLPSETSTNGELQRRLKSGALLFPNGWSLRSKFNTPPPESLLPEKWEQWLANKRDSLVSARLGKTSFEIHDSRVPHYMDYFAKSTERAFRNMTPGEVFWRRNWTVTFSDRLFRHADQEDPRMPDPTLENWHMLGQFRIEHQTFRKLPQSEAVVFGIKTYIWPVRDLQTHPKACAALLTALENFPPAMAQYKGERINPLRELLQVYTREQKEMEMERKPDLKVTLG